MNMRIKEIMSIKGFTNAALAEKMNISKQAVGKMINAESLTTATLERIAAALDVPVWQLFASPSEVSAEPPHDDFCAFVRCNGVSHTPETLADLRRLVDELGE